MYLKIHQSPKGRIVAVCDEDLIGRVLREKDAELDLDRYRGFYVGGKADEAEVKEALRRFHSANIVGRESVGLALALGLAGEGDVMYINKIPYIQIYKL